MVRGSSSWVSKYANARTENFSTWIHESSIRDDSKIFSACGDAKLSFVGAADIARVAFHALTDEKIFNTDIQVVGPDLLTYDEV
jgi:festuclavine dehydrogenase